MKMADQWQTEITVGDYIYNSTGKRIQTLTVDTRPAAYSYHRTWIHSQPWISRSLKS